MAQPSRSYFNSSVDWTYNELYACNISITPVSPADFFQPTPDPSLGHLDPSILTTHATDADDLDLNLSDATSEYLGYLDLATRGYQESATIDFAAATLRLLGFGDSTTTVATRHAIPLVICGETRAAQTDVCVIHRPSRTILLVLVIDRTIFGDDTAVGNVEAQVVAGAIAVYQFNNDARAANGLPVLEAMTVPCISMSGTKPTFYVMAVTRKLSDAVITDQYPASETRLMKCVTTPKHRGRAYDGMANFEFRETALKRFLAFKYAARSYWKQYMD
ncbi:hypothetical protein DFP72DRAFT_1015857 [Ephemerocybe angulata]|uniref:Uncharacterized protein n=1 Tax=Ephemerocybe angulata TaxID=980116 RepID=A0A8H6LXS2_9AGAR|nr:hypothetical protein DFP72DRAFT_1015857 [Tulosesus angulatus]